MCTISFGPVKSTISTIIHYVSGSGHIALIMAAGDILMQHFNGNKEIKHINWQRTIKFASIGFCFMGPILTYWKNIITTIINANQIHAVRIFKQLFCNQIYLAPCINLGIITISGVLKNESVLEIKNRLRNYFPYLIKRHYMFWPGVEIFANICIQPTRQVVFEDFIAILWYAFISGILHKDEKLKNLK